MALRGKMDWRGLKVKNAYVSIGEVRGGARNGFWHYQVQLASGEPNEQELPLPGPDGRPKMAEMQAEVLNDYILALPYEAGVDPYEIVYRYLKQQHPELADA
jgi:hypothetical protein